MLPDRFCNILPDQVVAQATWVVPVCRVAFLNHNLRKGGHLFTRSKFVPELKNCILEPPSPQKIKNAYDLRQTSARALI